tara:strand:- start:29315 stop:30265 length:951 start_codon:yes stop_codon:yes gene_type:complete
MTALVSIIMPCYNCEKTIEKTLRSIYEQNFTNFHLYCINDGSTDNTAEMLEHYAQSKPNISILHKDNAGQTAAKNDGLKIAQGEYIAFIDSDDLWHSSKLMKQVQLLDKNNKIGLCYTNGFYINETGQQQELIGVSDDLTGQCLDQIILGNAIVASSVMIRKSILDKVGLFDERLSACENWELWTRFASQSELASIDEPLVFYRRHANNMSHNLDKMRKNRLAVIAINKQLYQHDLKYHKKIIRDAYYTAYKFFGENYLWTLQVKKARPDLLRALCYKPWNKNIYMMIMKTLLGKKLLSKIRQFKRHKQTEIETTA